MTEHHYHYYLRPGMIVDFRIEALANFDYKVVIAEDKDWWGKDDRLIYEWCRKNLEDVFYFAGCTTAEYWPHIQITNKKDAALLRMFFTLTEVKHSYGWSVTAEQIAQEIAAFNEKSFYRRHVQWKPYPCESCNEYAFLRQLKRDDNPTFITSTHEMHTHFSGCYHARKFNCMM